MPGFNQTGPRGEGPMTGRQMGKCNDSGAERRDFVEGRELDNLNASEGRGMGRGLGRGRGRGVRGFGRGIGLGLNRGFEPLFGYGRGCGCGRR